MAWNEDAEYAGERSGENGKINVLPGWIIRAGPRRNLCEEQGEGKQRCSTDKREKREMLCARERKQTAWMVGRFSKCFGAYKCKKNNEKKVQIYGLFECQNNI